MNDSADQLSDESSGGNPVAIARIVGDFGAELHRGGNPRIEEFLRLVAAGDRHELLQCLIAECVEWQLCRGTEPQLAELLARFPDREDVVKAGFKAGTAAFQSQKNAHDAGELPPTELAPPPRPSQKEIPAVNAQLPDSIGPYSVKRRLGSGQFGDVYHAWDPTHNRPVALKCVRSKQNEEPSDTQRRMFLDEWRKLEGLSHEGIVRVYGVLQHQGSPVIVQELAQGGTLRELLNRAGGCLPLEQAVSLTMDICKALVYLHSQQIYHRDLKPDNVLLNESGRAKLMDFGLALHRSDRSSTPYAVAGSLAYMAPEQILGKAHLQDGRCDLWAVGVMLYEMIVGERPFQESSPADLKRAILHGAATPPHQIKSAIPRALGDICQSCLERKLRNRYSSAQDVLADLESCLSPEPPQKSQQLRPSGAATASDSDSGSGSSSGPGSGAGGSGRSGPVEVSQPTLELRGLRSYGEDDSEIFLQLLPGRRASDGLPTEVSAFRRKLEQCEAHRTFPVGLIHGPSGCGKTSLMRAGIQPRLAAHVSSVYLECSGEGTESRLRHELQRNFPNLPADVRLSEVVLRMIEGEWLPAGRKLVVVLDQFEQWLYRHGAEARTELGDALAECDGGRVQFVLMIRDDFWSGLERFLQRTDLPVTDDSYRLFVDVFDRQHGERVLTLLGQGAGCLPQRLTTECRQFVRQAVQQLAGAGGTVDCARLSLLAFMLRRQQWTLKTLQSLGGLDGLGERFLSQSFTDAGADPVHRRYVTVARAVLGALLPNEGQDIRTQRVSRSSLEGVVQRVDRHADAGLVLRILDRELRLITPAEPDPTTSVVTPGETGNSAVRVPGYQLTHDYLVPSLRRWINAEQERTAAGRAELLLERRERLYRGKRERRQLPSLMEWAQIRWHVPRRRWTVPQQQMMSVAGAWHLVQSAIASTVLMILLFAGLLLYSNTLVENIEQLEVAGLVDAARDMQPVRFIVGPLLERKQQTAVANDNAELATKTLLTRLPLGAVSLSEGDLQLLQDAVNAAKPADLVHLTSLLQPVNRDLVPRLQALLENSGEPATKRLNAACVLAGLAMDKQTPWSRKSTSEFVVGELFSIAKQAPATLADYELAIRSQATRWVPVVADTIAATPVSEEVTPGIWQLLTLDGDVRNQAVDYLKTELMRVPSPWNDPPLKPEWTQPERMQELTSAVAAAKGILDERSGFCLDMRLSQFRKLENSFRASGYRPTRVRPHAGPADEDPRLAVVWVRDGLEWKLDDSVPLAELPARDANVVLDEFVLSDIAYVAGNGSHSRWLLLWSARLAEEDERRYIAGETEEKFLDSAERYAAAGFNAQSTISVYNDPEGVRRYSGVFVKWAQLTYRRFQIAPDDLEEKQLIDIAVAAIQESSQPRDPRAKYRKELSQLFVFNENLQNANIRFRAAVARFHTNQEEAALGDLDWLIENPPAGINPGRLFVYQAVALARVKRHDEAAAAMNRLQKTSLDQSYKDYVAIQLAAWRKDVQVATEMLDKAETEYGADPNGLYNMVCAAALASEALGQLQLPEQQAKFRARALSILKTAIEMPNGYSNLLNMLQDVDLAELHDAPEFLAVMKKLYAGRKLAAVTGSAFVTRVTTAASLDEILSKLQSDQVWRPGSVAVDLVNGIPVAMLLERRPRLTEAQQEQLSAKRSGMATAILKLNSRQLPADLLADNPANIADPTLRNLVLHRIPLFGVLVSDLLAQIETSSDPGIRRAAIQGLGELAQQKLLTPDEQGEVGSQVIRFHADRDPGVHSAAAWTLRQLGVEPPDSGGSAEWKIDDGPFWERRRFGSVEMEFAVFDGRKERGSGIVSRDERQRPYELQRPFNIGRCYEIGLYEVSEKNYAASLLPEESAKFLDGQTLSDRPAGVSWNQAAEYCNWLSEQHGFPSDQWCYEGTKPFGSGMKLKKNWRDLPGYRLPSEAEWEFACRAGTETEYSCGDNPKLLADYGWYDVSAFRRNGPFVAGQKRPNRYGLFDVHGNMWEWCQDPYVRGQAGGPEEGDALIKDDTPRVLRGGSFYDVATNMRSALRGGYFADGRDYYSGFRVSRTYPLPP
jgi:serine/threonine protein kinase